MATDPNDPTTSEDEHQPAGVDRVMEQSTNKDGSPDQSDGFEVIEDPNEEEEEATETRKSGRRRKAEPETTAER